MYSPSTCDLSDSNRVVIDCETAARWEDGYHQASVINHLISSGPHSRGRETSARCGLSASSCPKFHMKFTLAAPTTVNQPVDKPRCESVTVAIKVSQSVSKQGSNFKCRIHLEGTLALTISVVWDIAEWTLSHCHGSQTLINWLELMDGLLLGPLLSISGA